MGALPWAELGKQGGMSFNIVPVFQEPMFFRVTSRHFSEIMWS